MGTAISRKRLSVERLKLRVPGLEFRVSALASGFRAWPGREDDSIFLDKQQRTMANSPEAVGLLGFDSAVLFWFFQNA